MTDMADLKDDIAEIKTGVENIYKILHGNGSEGLVTRAALNKSAIGRIWWWLGGVSLSIMGIAAYVIRGGMT